MNFKPLQNGKYSFLFRNDTSIDDVIENVALVAKEHINLCSTDEDIADEIEKAVYLFGLTSLISQANDTELVFIYEKVSGEKIVPSFYADEIYADETIKDCFIIIDANGEVDRPFDEFWVIKDRLEYNMDREDFDNAFPHFFDDLIAFFKPIVIYKIKGGA